MNGGYIKIHRQMLEWEWWSDANTTRLWLYLLLAANYEDKRWQGMVIERGQLVTSREHLSEATGLSVQQVRTCLERLKSTSEITIKTTNKYTLITICKYADYQLNEEAEQPAKQPAGEQTNNHQITTTKEIKNNKETSISTTNVVSIESKKLTAADKSATRSLEEREKEFYDSLVPYVAQYGKEMIRAFYNYWTQRNKNGRKMLFEMQKVFDLPKRLVTWAGKEKATTTPSSQTDSRKFFNSDVEEYTEGI